MTGTQAAEGIKEAYVSVSLSGLERSSVDAETPGLKEDVIVEVIVNCGGTAQGYSKPPLKSHICQIANSLIPNFFNCT